MSRFTNEDSKQTPLNLAVAEVLADRLDDHDVEASAQRVWQRLTAAAAAGLTGCGSDLGRDIPVYLQGGLTAARRALVEDHARECIPCRRALATARQGRIAHDASREAGAAANFPDAALGEGDAPVWSSPAWGAPPALGPGASPARRWLPLAALLVAGLGLALTWAFTAGPWGAAPARMASVEAVDGRMYRVQGATSVPVVNGDVVTAGEQLRTAKTSHAVLRMTDGSRIEMAERAGLSLSQGRGGNTIELDHGRIIVQAAHQRPHHLYVTTADCRVAVTGTIFAVNHGIRGSRVSVIQGQVRVERSAPASPSDLGAFGAPGAPGDHRAIVPAVSVLDPGQQVTTRASVTAVPVAQEVSWSRDAQRYNALLAALPAITAAGRQIDGQIAAPALRTTSRLLDLVPAGTQFYISLPNVSANLVQAQQLLEQRLADDPVLAQWWNQVLGSPAAQAQLNQLVQQIGDVGGYLGNEVVISAGSGGSSTPAGSAGNSGGAGSAGSAAAAAASSVVLLAETSQEAALRATLTQQIAAINQRLGRTALVLLSQLPAAGQPAAPPAGGKVSAVSVWVGQGLLVASPSPAQIATVVANVQSGAFNPFVSSAFHARMTQAYSDGAGWLFGVDLQQLMAASASSRTSVAAQRMAAMGLADLQDFIVERHNSAAPGAAAAADGGNGGASDLRAALTFSQSRRGIASWLAAPAPMGSLGFFSADANLVAAFVVKSPVDLLDELLALSPEMAANLAKAEAQHGFNLRDDLAAPLGGEIALGMDGPVLPTPSWKLVVEVYDPVRLQQTVAGAVTQLNADLIAQGRPGVTLAQDSSGGQTWYTISSSQPQISLCYVYADGYLVAAPTRALVAAALAQRAAGTTLATAAGLKNLLGRDGQVNVSALFYQNLAPLMGSLGAAMGAGAGSEGAAAGSPGQRATGVPSPPSPPVPPSFRGLLAGMVSGPSLLYAYGETDRIVIAGHGQGGPLGRNLAVLAGFGGVLGRIDSAHGAAASKAGRSHQAGAGAGIQQVPGSV